MAKTGRPTRYSEKYHIPWGITLAENGLTDVEIAEKFGIATSTLYKWKKAHPEFSEAIADAKINADEVVERAMYQNAIGYSHPEDKIFADAKSGSTVVVPTVKHYPPNQRAGEFWLTNRQGEKWSNKQEIGLPDGPLMIVREKATKADAEDGE